MHIDRIVSIVVLARLWSVLSDHDLDIANFNCNVNSLNRIIANILLNFIEKSHCHMIYKYLLGLFIVCFY